jgi:hypothetical protein
MTTTGAEQILTPPALARLYSPKGYTDGWEQVKQYLQVVEWADSNPDASWYAAANELGLPESRVRRWYNENKPSVVKQIEIADALGWMDATWDSAIGRAFNLVVAATLSGGTLSEKFQHRIALDDDLDPATEQSLRKALTVLVGSTKLLDEEDPQRATSLKAGEHASLLGRALHAIGVPTVRKTDPEFTFPDYLTSVSEQLRREFVELYVLFRGSRIERGTMDIREERTEDYLQSLATLIEEVTGGTATVRTNGIFLRKSVVDDLAGRVVWNDEA